MKLRMLAMAAVVATFTALAYSQQRNPLVGVWELTSQINAQGEVNKNINSQLLVFTEEGVYVWAGLAKGRPKVEKPVAELTDQELRARYSGVGPVQHGTYTVSGNRVTRQITVALDPRNDGTQPVQQFRIDGDTLIVTPADTPGSKAENRYRRVRRPANATR